MKFDMLALLDLLYNISRKLEETSIINTRSIDSKWYWYFVIHMGVTKCIFSAFFPTIRPPGPRRTCLKVSFHENSLTLLKIEWYKWYIADVRRGENAEIQLQDFSAVTETRFARYLQELFYKLCLNYVVLVAPPTELPTDRARYRGALAHLKS